MNKLSSFIIFFTRASYGKFRTISSADLNHKKRFIKVPNRVLKLLGGMANVCGRGGDSDVIIGDDWLVNQLRSRDASFMWPSDNCPMASHWETCRNDQQWQRTSNNLQTKPNKMKFKKKMANISGQTNETTNSKSQHGIIKADECRKMLLTFKRTSLADLHVVSILHIRWRELPPNLATVCGLHGHSIKVNLYPLAMHSTTMNANKSHFPLGSGRSSWALRRLVNRPEPKNQWNGQQQNGGGCWTFDTARNCLQRKQIGSNKSK